MKEQIFIDGDFNDSYEARVKRATGKNRRSPTMKPLINILIRTSNRHKEFDRCIASIRNQHYEPLRLIICTDKKDLDYMHIVSTTSGLDRTIIFVESTGVPYHWNFYCNNLKSYVQEGWFFYLDDDDYIKEPDALSTIAKHLTDPNEGVICQFNRGNSPKPVYDYCELSGWGSDYKLSEGKIVESETNGKRYVRPSAIIRGRIGGSCIFLHASKKDVAAWDGKRAADYRFIKAVSEKIPLRFVPIVVVQAGNGGRHGK